MKQSYRDLMHRSAQYRGEIISEVIAMEKLIDQFICEHFCKTEELQNEMYLMFLGDNRTSFDSKKQIFDWIIKKHYKDWAKSFCYDSYNDNSSGKFAITKAISHITEQRNIVAHRMIRATNADLLEHDKVTFVQVKNEVKPIEYTSAKVSEIAMLILAVNTHIMKKIVRYSKSPSNPLSVDSQTAITGG